MKSTSVGDPGGERERLAPRRERPNSLVLPAPFQVTVKSAPTSVGPFRLLSHIRWPRACFVTGPVCRPGASKNATEKNGDCPRAVAPGPGDRQAVLGPRGDSPSAGSTVPVVTKRTQGSGGSESSECHSHRGISGKMGRRGCGPRAGEKPRHHVQRLVKEPALVSG